MSINHLTDQQIQSYVEGEPAHDTAEMAKHLSSCKWCRKQLNAYKFIRSGMAQEPQGAFFSKDFDNLLMTKILQHETRGFLVRDYLVIAFIIAIVISLLCYPLLFEQIRILIWDSYIESWALLKETTIGILCKGAINGSCWMIPLIALTMLLSFMILDKTYVQSRLKRLPDEV